MSRERAISAATAYFDDGRYVADLARRVAIQTESQNPARLGELRTYLRDEMAPVLESLECSCRILDNPVAGGGPFLIAQRMESPELPTVLSYGHGDVVLGYDAQWREGLSPWVLSREGDRLYGRGTADNKGQHTVNLAALEAVMGVRGALGFNFTLLLETGEEIGSPGLREICDLEKRALDADVLIASDGPRIDPGRPTLYLGTRGALNFELTVDLREGSHHSGNWGGLLANPGILLAHAIASIASASGRIRVPQWRPAAIPDLVRRALDGLRIDGGANAPSMDAWWGEPGLTAPEKVFAWSSFEVLAFTTGNPEHPVNAIPPRATATCHVRFTVDVDADNLLPALREHLDENGLSMVELNRCEEGFLRPTRLDPEHPWVRWAAASLMSTTGKEPAILPNVGGSLPNDIFAEGLGLPTVWIPHSYGGCSQHAPNEHVLVPLQREALAVMAGVFWDLGEAPPKGGERAASQRHAAGRNP